VWPGLLVLILWTNPDGWIEKVWPVTIVLNSSECLQYGEAYLKDHAKDAVDLIDDGATAHIVCVSPSEESTAAKR